MTIETATYISQLDATYPASGDAKSEGDNHLRLIKSAVKATWPNLTATPVTTTSAELNYVTGVTSSIQGQINSKAALASPVFTGTPTVPTATPGTNSTQAASTAYADAADSLKVTKAGDTYTGSHVMTGATVTVATATAGDNSNKAASTTFVTNAITAAALVSTLPNQTGNAGKVISTDGTNAIWTALKTIGGNSLLGSGDIAVNGGSTTTSSAVDMALTAASTRVQLVTMTAASKKITLPDATTLTTGGQIFVITNNGALAFALRSNGGALVGSIQPAQTVICYLADNSTAAGIWVLNEGTSNGVFSTPLPGTVTSVNAATVTGVGITALSPTLALIVYRENTGNIIARTLTISGTTITVNTALTFVTSSAAALCPVVAVSATQAVVCFTNNLGTSFDACTLNISGTTVTAGAVITVIGTAVSTASIAKRSSTEVVACAGYSSTNVGVYPISISGTTLTAGTSASLATQNTVQSLVMLSSTLGVFSSQNGAATVTRYGYVTFSGAVATLVGSYTNIDSPPTVSDRLVTPSLAMLTATRFLTVGDQFMGAASPAIKVWLGEAPTNTGSPSFSGGITVAYAKDGSAAPKIQRITDTTAMLTWMGSAGFIYACEISVNGSTITAGPVVALNAVSSSAPVICSLSSGAQVVAYIGTSSYAQAVVLENA